MNTIFLIGAVLVGCGVVAFVAAHWFSIPRWYKVGALLAAFLAAHGIGYYLWRIREPARPYLGHALTVLGTLIFCANIALFAQIFHISEHLYGGFAAGALGALLVALALRSIPNAVLAVILSFAWFVGFTLEWDTPLLPYPVLAAAVFLPICYWFRSRLLFALTVLAVAVSLDNNAGINVIEHGFWMANVGGILSCLLLWCYGMIHPDWGEWPAFGAIARSLAAFALATLAYFSSFHKIAETWAADATMDKVSQVLGGHYMQSIWNCIPLATILVLLIAVAIVAGRGPAQKMPRFLVPVLVTLGILLAPFLPQPVIYTTIAYNVIALFLGIYGIGVGVATSQRRPYLAGLLLIALLIASRFFEYDTQLMIKAVGFIAVGLGFIYAGFKFEKRLRAQLAESPVAPPPQEKLDA